HAPRRRHPRPARPPTPANMLEHAPLPRHRHQPRPAAPPTPRPAVTPTSSNTLVEHTIDNDNGQHNDPVSGQQTRPHHRTHEKPAPPTAATTTNRPVQRPNPRPANKPHHRTREKPAPPTPR